MSNLLDSLKPEYPEDIAEIRKAAPVLGRFSDIEVEVIYKAFSRAFGGSWLDPSGETIKNFTEWLED